MALQGWLQFTWMLCLFWWFLSFIHSFHLIFISQFDMFCLIYISIIMTSVVKHHLSLYILLINGFQNTTNFNRQYIIISYFEKTRVSLNLVTFNCKRLPWMARPYPPPSSYHCLSIQNCTPWQATVFICTSIFQYFLLMYYVTLLQYTKYGCSLICYSVLTITITIYGRSSFKYSWAA